MPQHDPKQIVKTARTYIETPFKHQGRKKGIGIDCAGLIIQVAKELEYFSDDVITVYSRLPDGHTVKERCEKFLERLRNKNDMQAGDVVLMRLGKFPQHVGILGNSSQYPFTIIHAYGPYKKVVEHRLDEKWERRIIAVYRYRVHE